jgi:hypothetical protein
LTFQHFACCFSGAIYNGALTVAVQADESWVNGQATGFNFVSMRAVRPEPEECLKIRQAMRVARFMKWIAVPVAWLAALIGLMLTLGSSWRLGLGIIVLAWGMLFGLGTAMARCPRCGQVWWSRMTTVTFTPWSAVVDRMLDPGETESLVCRRCYLDIAVGLREKGLT